MKRPEFQYQTHKNLRFSQSGSWVFNVYKNVAHKLYYSNGNINNNKPNTTSLLFVIEYYQYYICFFCTKFKLVITLRNKLTEGFRLLSTNRPGTRVCALYSKRIINFFLSNKLLQNIDRTN